MNRLAPYNKAIAALLVGALAAALKAGFGHEISEDVSLELQEIVIVILVGVAVMVAPKNKPPAPEEPKT